MIKIKTVKTMEHVIKLLKGRKAAAKLELSYCEEGNEHYDKAKEKLTEEIKQLDKSLLILSNVVGQSELLRAYFIWHKEQGFVSHKDSDIDEFLASNSH